MQSGVVESASSPGMGSETVPMMPASGLLNAQSRVRPSRCRWQGELSLARKPPCGRGATFVNVVGVKPSGLSVTGPRTDHADADGLAQLKMLRPVVPSAGRDGGSSV